MNKKTFLGLAFFSVVIMVAMVNWPFSVVPVGAQGTSTEGGELQGWAWSDSTGWVSFNHKQYSGGSAPGAASSGDTGWKTPSSATTKQISPSYLDWTNPTNSLTEDDEYTSVYVENSTKHTNYLENRDFGLRVPSGASITGVEMCFKRAFERSSGWVFLSRPTVYDRYIKLIKPDGSYSEDKSQYGQWGNKLSADGVNSLSESVWACYGGADDTWGVDWTSSDIASPDFGTAISVEMAGNDGGVKNGHISAYIDAVRVKVFYEQTPGVPPAGSDLNYAVKIDREGKLAGYAWSLNLGWIKFAPNLYPSGTCQKTNDCYGAKIVKGGTIDEVKGWARVCSVYKNGCEGALRSESELGGWDGWVRMHNVKRNSSGSYFGYAWGDLNLAWLNFGFGVGDDGDNGPCDPNKQVCDDGGIIDDADCDSETECCEGDTFPDNPNCGLEVTITVSSSCAGEESPYFNPTGGSCGNGDYCQTYQINSQNITVGFAGLELGTIQSWSSTGDQCQSQSNNDNFCTINKLTQNTRLTANCAETPIGECYVAIQSGAMSLVESKNLDYGTRPLSNAAMVVLKTAEGAMCNGTYNLNYEIIDGDNDGLSILCYKGGSYGEDCSNLSKETPIKAQFTKRPEESPKLWNVKLQASRGEEFSIEKTYQGLIRYQRKAAN